MPENQGGYGHPPIHTRFKAGQSGNPSGRPKGSNGLKALIREALDQPTKITTNGTSCTVTVGRAIVDSLLKKARKGNLRAIEVTMKAGDDRVVEIPVAFVVGEEDAGH